MAYASLRVTSPPAAEPVSVALAKQHLRLDQSYDDTLVQLYITAARQLAENYLNRAFITQGLRYSMTNTPPPTSSPLVPQSLIVFPLNWPPVIRKPIALPRAPAQSVSQVAWGPIEEVVPADPSDWVANIDVEPAQVMLAPQLVPMLPAMSIQIDYVAGMADDPADLPADMVVAVLQLVAMLYEGRGDVDSSEGGAAWRLLAPHRLWTFSG